MIDPGFGVLPKRWHVLPGIIEHINQSRANLAGSPQDAAVIAVGKHPAGTADLVIESLREPNRQPLHAAR